MEMSNFVDLSKMAKKKKYNIFHCPYRTYERGCMVEYTVLVISRQFDKGSIELVTSDNLLITSNGKEIYIKEGTLRKTFFVEYNKIKFDVFDNKFVSEEDFMGNRISKSKHFSEYESFIQQFFTEPLN